MNDGQTSRIYSFRGGVADKWANREGKMVAQAYNPPIKKQTYTDTRSAILSNSRTFVMFVTTKKQK